MKTWLGALCFILAVSTLAHAAPETGRGGGVNPTDANIQLTDITTNNASTSKHGFMPKLPNNAGLFANGVGGFTAPAGTPCVSLALTIQYNNAGVFGCIASDTAGMVLTSNGVGVLPSFQAVAGGGGGGGGTVTSIATTSPITGGTITASGAVACPTCATSAAALTLNQLVFGSGGQGLAVGDLTGDVTTSGGKATTIRRMTNASVGTSALTATYSNDTVTGTTVNKLAKLSGAPSKAIITAITDTGGAVGIVVSGAGLSGSAEIAIVGLASCVFDGATTAGDYVQISPTINGACHDSGSAYPVTGQVVGRVLSTNGAAGTYLINQFDEVRGFAPGTIASSGTPTINTLTKFTATTTIGNSAITDNGSGTIGFGDCTTNCQTWDYSAVTGLKTITVPNASGTLTLLGNTAHGTGTNVQMFTGSAPATNDCAKFDVNGNVTGAGQGCGSGAISGLTTGTLPKAASATSLTDSIVSENGTTVNIGTGAATGIIKIGTVIAAKITASASAPGAGSGKIEFVCGTNSGSGKLIAYGGTSATAVTILDNIGSGVTGC